MIDVLGVAGNATVSVAYLAICAAILVPLVRAGQVRTNRLGTSTAAIFFSCAVGHAFHGWGAVSTDPMAGMHGTSTVAWVQVAWDLTTAAVAVNYWTQRRTYGSLMEGAALFEGLEQRRRITELEHREALASARADAELERRAHAEETARSEATFEAAFDGALVGMCLTGLDGRYLRVNQVFAAILDRTQDELTGLTFRNVTHPDDVVLGEQLRSRVVAGELTGLRQSKRFLRPDGTVVHVELSSALVRDSAGAPLHFSAQVIDVTDRVLAERDRDRQQQLLTAIIDNSQSVVHAKDLRGRYLLANTLMQRALGRTEAEIIGRTDAEVHAHVNPAWAENDRRARLGVHVTEETVTRADGVTRVYESVRFPLHDLHGVVYGTCGTSLDVTARRQLAAEQEAAARAIAEAAQAKSQFLATMSHEIRTPLNGVLGLMSLLAASPLDRQQLGWARAAEGSGRALLAIVNDVLDTAKIEAGAVQLESIPLDLLDLVDVALTPIRASAEEKDLSLVIGPSRGLARHRLGDPTRLQQVVTNLVSNAVKFTDRGTVTVLLDGGPTDVRITVTDTGIGMTAEQREKLFTPYVQAEASTTRRFGGTGLGMSIVHGLVEQMGGTIAVTSSPGMGTSFRVDIPLPSVAAPRRPVRVQPPVDPSLAGLRVLVAEDNEVNQMVARYTLEAHGLVVDIVADGAAAVEAVLAGGHVAVLMDCQMPVMDGLEATRRIRAAEAARASGDRPIPIIAMTASAFDADRTACRDAGMTGFLPKPWTPEQLQHTLTHVAKRARPALQE